MKRLTETQFFVLLKKNKTDPTEIQQEYERFAVLLFSEYSASADDRATFHNTLVFTYVELSCLLPDTRQNVTVYLEKAIELLDKQIELAERQWVAKETGVHCPLTVKSAIRKIFDWTGEPVELVELLYALHEAGCLGKTKLKKLFDDVGKLFGIEIKNFSRLFWGAKARGDRTKFLDKLKQTLTDKIEKSDEKPPRK
jgi:hypothetical protein